MALSYNLGYQESISVHPTRRQNFAGKPYSNFPISENDSYIGIYANVLAMYSSSNCINSVSSVNSVNHVNSVNCVNCVNSVSSL